MSKLAQARDHASLLFLFTHGRCKPWLRPKGLPKAIYVVRCGVLPIACSNPLDCVSTQEVQAFAAVEGHPNIVTFYDSWAETDQSSNADHFFIRLELCGVSLKEVVASNKGYCWKETELLDLMRQVGETVYMHACLYGWGSEGGSAY